MVTSKPPLLLLMCVVIASKSLTFFCILLLFCNRKQVIINNADVHGLKVMGWANQRLVKLLVGSPEDLRFCVSFGVSAEVASDHNCLPPTRVPPLFVGTRIHANVPANGTALSTM